MQEQEPEHEQEHRGKASTAAKTGHRTATGRALAGNFWISETDLTVFRHLAPTPMASP